MIWTMPEPNPAFYALVVVATFSAAIVIGIILLAVKDRKKNEGK
jgi:hypothetical protein